MAARGRLGGSGVLPADGETSFLGEFGVGALVPIPVAGISAARHVAAVVRLQIPPSSRLSVVPCPSVTAGTVVIIQGSPYAVVIPSGGHA